MTIKRTICGIEWRVLSPSLYAIDKANEDSIAVFYHGGTRSWRIADRTYVHPTGYPTRNAAMAELHFALERVHA